MHNIGENIVTTENLERNIQKLSAQRELYSRAKTTLGWQIFLAVPVTLILAIVNLYLEKEFQQNIEWAVAGYALFLLATDSLILTKNDCFKKRKSCTRFKNYLIARYYN